MYTKLTVDLTSSSLSHSTHFALIKCETSLAIYVMKSRWTVAVEHHQDLDGGSFISTHMSQSDRPTQCFLRSIFSISSSFLRFLDFFLLLYMKLCWRTEIRVSKIPLVDRHASRIELQFKSNMLEIASLFKRSVMMISFLPFVLDEKCDKFELSLVVLTEISTNT